VHLSIGDKEQCNCIVIKTWEQIRCIVCIAVYGLISYWSTGHSDPSLKALFTVSFHTFPQLAISNSTVLLIHITAVLAILILQLSFQRNTGYYEQIGEINHNVCIHFILLH
jgi:hypothetical protein